AIVIWIQPNLCHCATVPCIMDERSTGKRRSTKTVLDTLSKVDISKQGLNISSVLPATNLQPRPNDTIPAVDTTKASLNPFPAEEGDILITQEAVKLKQNVDASILNAKKLYELSNTAAVKGITAKGGNRKASEGTLFVTKPPSPTRSKQLLGKTADPKASSRNPRKGTTASEILHTEKLRKTDPVHSLSSKLKRAISFNPLTSVAKTPSVQTPDARNRHYSKVVTHIVKRLGGRASGSSVSLPVASQSKTPSPKSSKKNKFKRRSWKKASLKKGKSEIPVTINNFFTTIKTVDNLHDLKKSCSKENVRRSSKKKGKSTNKLKASTSEIKANPSLRLATLSTPKLAALPSPRSLLLRSVSKPVSTDSNKIFKKAISASKISVSKSATTTKRPTSAMSKPEPPQTAISGRAMSVSKLHEPPHRSLSVAKTKINKANSSVHILSTPRLQESKDVKKSLSRRPKSAMQLRVEESEKKRVKSKVKKSKSKTLNNANANNVNDTEDKEALQSDSPPVVSLTPVCRDSQTEASCHDAVSTVSFDDLVVLSGEINDDSKYNPQESITFYLSKSMDKPFVNASQFENKNTNFSSKPTYEFDGSHEEDKLYNMCFMDLVKNGFDEDMFPSVNVHPKTNKQRVRFNLQLAERMARNMKQGSLEYDPARYGNRVKPDALTYVFRNTDSPANEHRKQRSIHSPDARLQLTSKSETKKWPNIWANVLRSRKWREVYSLVDSSSATDLVEETSCDEETESSHLQPNRSEHDMSTDGHKTLKPPKKIRKKQRSVRSRRQRESSAGTNDNPPSDVVFPPYTCRYNEEGSSDLSAEHSANTTFSYLQLDLSDASASHHSEEAIEIPALRLPACSNKKQAKFQLKWLHLVEHLTKEIQKDCLVKGYEILQRLSRGNPRVHSLLFLANNRNNPLYSPIEITAIRWPYACFTSSVISLGGAATGRQYIQTWVNALPPHSNLIMLLHRFCTDNWVYHVTQHCPWPSLDHLIRQSSTPWGPGSCQGLPENACKTIFKQICAGMGHLHQHDVLHGDLNCSNILVSNMLQVKLAGYGPVCQRMMSPIQSIKGHVPLQGDSYNVNTPPELMARRDVWTKSCDVWCMGITLLQMVIGEISHEVNSAIRLNGCNNPVARLHLPNCGYQLSRLIDKILQPNAINRPSVFHISNHPWLCDVTDLAAVLWQRSNKNAVRRTDGSTFPLPKRFQNLENRSDESIYASSESDCSAIESYDILTSQDREEDDTYLNSYKSDFLANLQKESTSVSKTLYKCGLGENWLTDKNRLVSSFNSLTSLSSSNRFEPIFCRSPSPKVNFISSRSSSRGDIMSFVNSKLKIEDVAIVNRNGVTERQPGKRIQPHNGGNDYQEERHKGCDLLKLMENLAPKNGNMELVK
ncbi:unnamed protein product, partial [Candidula unifasciata]